MAPEGLSQPAAAAAAVRSNSCSWCGAALRAADLSCPSCGAAVDVAALVSESGWVQLPGRRDMAKLQFGQSYCQIEGQLVPVAEMALAGADWVYFSHHVFLWKEPSVQLQAMSLRAGWQRQVAGMPLIMTNTLGPGRIAFSHDAPGELIAVPLQTGQMVDVREGLFMVASCQVGYDWFDPGVWFQLPEGRYVYPVGYNMDRFGAATAPGLLLIYAAGNVFVRRLAAEQSILVKPTAFVFKDPAVSMHLYIETPRGAASGWPGISLKHTWVRLTGPGRVAVKSVSEPVEGEHHRFVRSSPAAQYQW